MELKLLRAFVCVADAGHFGRAASTLCVTQPALSKQIAGLEATLGARLLQRGRLGASLTPFGRVFLDDARRLVDDMDAVLLRSRQASRGERGSLAVGFGLSTLALAPACIARFCAQYPQVEVVLNDMASAEQTRKLLAGQLDAGFVRLPVPSGLASLPLLDEQLALAVPERSPLQALPPSLEALNEAGFVLLARPRGPGLAGQIDQWCAAHSFVPRCTQRVDDVQTVLAIVAAGLGVSLLPLRSADVRSQGVRFIPLSHATARWQVGLAWRPQPQNAVVERFVALVRAGAAA
ncbi:LysR substrate-binding domain-containing protein [Rhodoferax sp.]|uniref:LysR family transcriptional regulator n=1 Tax=Rhodoferax sp. TaxID=50421 RepID=UPI00374D4106